MRPAIARPTTPPRDAIHDDRRVGGSPPGRTMRDAAHPPHPGRGGGDAPASRPARKIRRRHDPSRPVPEADRQPDPPPPRSRGPRRARGLDAASGRPRADPAAAAGLFGLVEEPDDDDGRRVLPPPGRRGPGTAPPGAAAGPGCLHPPAHGPDGAVASSTADAAVSHAHPDPRAKKTTAPSRTRSPRGPPGTPPSAVRSRRAPPRSRHQRRDRGAPRHPATRHPTACTTGLYDPATPATGPDPWTIPRTTRPSNPAPHPGTDTTQPHLTITPPTAQKTPNTPVLCPASPRGSSTGVGS